MLLPIPTDSARIPPVWAFGSVAADVVAALITTVKPSASTRQQPMRDRKQGLPRTVHHVGANVFRRFSTFGVIPHSVAPRPSHVLGREFIEEDFLPVGWSFREMLQSQRRRPAGADHVIGIAPPEAGKGSVFGESAGMAAPKSSQHGDACDSLTHSPTYSLTHSQFENFGDWH